MIEVCRMTDVEDGQITCEKNNINTRQRPVMGKGNMSYMRW